MFSQQLRQLVTRFFSIIWLDDMADILLVPKQPIEHRLLIGVSVKSPWV